MNKMPLAVLTAAIIGAPAFTPAYADADWPPSTPQTRVFDRIDRDSWGEDHLRAQDHRFDRDKYNNNRMIQREVVTQQYVYPTTTMMPQYRTYPSNGTMYQYSYPSGQTMYRYPTTQEYRYVPSGEVIYQEYQYRNPTWR